MDALPGFPSLTPDDRVWRLDWFGECAYPGSVRHYAQPSIKVVPSPLRVILPITPHWFFPTIRIISTSTKPGRRSLHCLCCAGTSV